jgi:hypothetical protein
MLATAVDVPHSRADEVLHHRVEDARPSIARAGSPGPGAVTITDTDGTACTYLLLCVLRPRCSGACDSRCAGKQRFVHPRHAPFVPDVSHALRPNSLASLDAP